MAVKMNASGMLDYNSITENLTIDAWGTVTDSDGKVALYGARGIYSDTLDFAEMVNTATSRIHANDLELKLDNGHTITVKNYFLYNGGTSFNYVVDKDSKTTSLLDAGFIENKNKYNEYNLAENHDEDGRITKTYITGTAFKDTVDLSGFDSEQLKYANGYPINQIVINTENGNDTITGSITNDYIIGGNGNNTLDYSTFITNNQEFGNDTYALTYKENVNLDFGNDTLPAQVVSEKVGSNIEIKVYKQEAETVEIAYEKTVVEGDTIATQFTKTVTEGDATAIKYQKYEIVANDEVETEGEHAGQYEKVTEVYIRNSENTDWVLADPQPESEWSETAVEADTKYSKSVNGVEGEKTATEPASYADEGAFNKTVKVFSRKDDNSDWKAEADSTTNSLVDSVVIGSEVVKKSVNGAEATTYIGTDFSDEGKFNQTVKVYSRNDDNSDWKDTTEDITNSTVDEAVTPSSVIKKSVNGAEATVYTEDTFTDEGKFNKTVKVFSRNDDNTDWNEIADSTTDTLSDEVVVTSTTVKKSVNGEDAVVYEGNDFSDEDKFNKSTTVYNYNGVRDLTQSDIANSELTLVDNNTVKKAIETTDLTAERQADGYEVVEGKLHHDAVYRAVNADDIVEGKIFVPATETEPAMVKDSEEGEPRAIVADDIKEDIRDKWSAENGIETAAEINQDLVQGDLATGWTIAEDKINATRDLAPADLTETAQTYEREAGTGKLVLWDEISETPEVVDSSVAPSTVYQKLTDGAGAEYPWDDSNKPTDMGTQPTGGTIVSDELLGKVVIPILGAYNDYATVKVNGTDIFDSSFYINAEYGGYIAGMRADEFVELGKYPTTFVAQTTGKNGYDSFYSEESNAPLLTYANYQHKLQDLVADFDPTIKNVDGNAEDNSFRYGDMITGEGVSFSNVDTTIVDKSGAAYKLSFANGDKDYSSQWTNNLVYAEAQEANKGVSVSTGVYNDVVVFGTAAADVQSAVTSSSPNFEKTNLFFDGDTLKYEKTAAKPAEYRDVTAEDLVDGIIFVDKTHVKDTEEGESRAIVADDIKEGLVWFAENGIETAAAVEQELVSITADNAAAAINGVSGYSWDGTTIKFTTENVNKVTYASGNDAFLGSTGKEEYDVATMNWSSNLTINDLGGDSDLIKFTDKNFSDMTIFFDVTNDGKAGSAGLTFISNDIAKSGNPYYALSFLQGNTTGGIFVENFFEQGETILDADKSVLEAAKGNGYIENVNVAGSSTSGSIDAQISQITQNVIAWLENNQNYDSAMEVANAGNASDIQSLMQCYTAGTTFTA